jgi:hypothetical protein
MLCEIELPGLRRLLHVNVTRGQVTMRHATVILAVSAAAFALGCGGGSGQADDLDAAVQPDVMGLDTGRPLDADGLDGNLSDGGADANPCPRNPAPADRPRKLVVSHPFTSGGNPADVYRLADLDTNGTITPTSATFQMGRSNLAEIVFTPDGEVGLVAQDDGSVGVFVIDGAGSVQVIHAAFQGTFYAGSVVMDPTGERAYVLDTQWRENGGGIYSVHIGCDGTLTQEGMLAPAKLAAAMAKLAAAMVYVPDGSDRVVVPADDILSSPTPNDTHLLDWGSSPSLLGSANAFNDEDAMIASAAATWDGLYVLIGDNSMFSGVPNRVAVVEILAGGLAPRQVLTPLEDPVALVASPHNNAAIVVSGYGDAIFVLPYDSNNPTTPFGADVELTYSGGPPQLPGKAVMLTRGQLEGWVFVAENLGVRTVVFETNGQVTDHGRTSFGAGTENIVGAIGVQP